MHLASATIAKLKGPLDTAAKVALGDALATLQLRAEASPGFVWRLAKHGDDSGYRSDEPGDGGDTGDSPLATLAPGLVVVDLSVWTGIGALGEYLGGRGAHRPLDHLKAWIDIAAEPLLLPRQCLWWVGVGHEPGIAEARVNLARLAANGSSAIAFTPENAWPGPEPESDRI